MKALILALGFTLASSVALAQVPGDGSSRMERMQKELDLTTEQVQQIRDIKKNGGSREEMRAVLTPEQQAKAVELRKAHGGKNAGGFERLKEGLGLSDEQVAQMRAILTPEQQAKLDALRVKGSAKKPK
jgi:Spy/CpxP family protein refolding chaperone